MNDFNGISKNCPEPVFVVGMNGSGTTMLADCLGNHSDLYMFPQETRVLTYFMKQAECAGRLDELEYRRQLMTRLGRSRAFWSVNGRKPVVLSDEELQIPSFAGTVDALFRYFAVKQGKRRWGEKSPMYIQYIGDLGRHFPHAKFIHIYRDGRDVARSFNRRWGHEPRRTIYRWKNVIRDGRRQGTELGPGRYLEIKYEELTANPEVVLRHICTFVGLPYDPAVTESSMRHTDPSLAERAKGMIVTNSGGWTSYFDPDDQIRLERIAGGFLEELGYEIHHLKGDDDPRAATRAFWEVRDRLRLVARHIVRQVRNPDRRVFVGFLRDSRDSLRQFRTNRH